MANKLPLPPPHGRQGLIAIDTYPHYRAAILVRVAGCDHKLVARGSELALFMVIQRAVSRRRHTAHGKKKGPAIN